MKPDASRSFAAADSAGTAGRARSGPHASPGRADQPGAGTSCAPAACTPRCSTAVRGRSRCTAASGAGTAHTRMSAQGDSQHPGSRQQASTPPLRAAKRPQESAVLKRWTKPVRRCNTLTALCARHGGARRIEQLSGRLGRRARSDPRRRHGSTAPPAAPARPPRPRLPAAPPRATPTRDAYRARCSQSSCRPSGHNPAAGLSTAAVGRRLRRTDRPPRWASRVRRRQLRQHLVNAPQSADDQLPSPSTDPRLLGHLW